MDAVAAGTLEGPAFAEARERLAVSAEQLKGAVGTVHSAASRAVAEEELLLGCWSAERAMEVAALEKMSHKMTMLPIVAQQHAGYLAPPEGAAPVATASLSEAMPQEQRAHLFHQMVDEALA